MSTRFRTYENHLSFVLQFLCDFGLYGCGWIELRNVLERGREAGDDETPAPQLPLSPHFRQSRMPLEVDAAAYHILNRHRLIARNIHHQLEVPAPPLPNEPFVPSVRELWEDERQRRSARGLNPSPEMPTVLSDQSRESRGEWVLEARWWEDVRKRIEREKEHVESDAESLDSRRWENSVMTTFESIEVLWEAEWKTWKPTRRNKENLPYNGVNGQVDSEDLKPVHVEEANEEIAVDVDISVLETQNIQFNDIDWNEYEEDDQDELEREKEEADGEQEDYDDDDLEDNESIHDDLSMINEEQNGGIDPDDVFSEEAQATDGPTSSLFPASFKEFPFNPQDIGDGDSDASDTSFNLWDPPASASDKVLIVPQIVEITGDHTPVSSPSKELPVLKRIRIDDDHEDPGDDRIHKKSRTVTFDISEEPQIRPSLSLQESATSDPPTIRTKLLRPLTRPSFELTQIANCYVYATPPPTSISLMKSLEDYGIPVRLYKPPYYSNELDVPAGPREYAGLVFELKGGDGIANLEEWVPHTAEKQEDASTAVETDPLPLLKFTEGWEYAGTPPSVREVKKWLSSPEGRFMNKAKPTFRSQIKGPTQANIYGLKTTPLAIKPEGSRARQDMTVLSLEIFAPSASGRVPDPKEDALFAVFYSFQTCDSQEPLHGIIVAEASGGYAKRLRGVHVRYVDTELELINETLDVVLNLDPDLIAGWEVQNSSWGYLANRASHNFSLEVEELLARAPPRARLTSEQYEARHSTTFHVAGRHVFNLWRIMRSEVTLGNYTFENVVFNVLGRRVPKYSTATLSQWCRSKAPHRNLNFLQHFIGRTSINIDLLNQSEMLTKTAEFARVFGVDFWQFLDLSMDRANGPALQIQRARIAKPESFVFISPSKKDVGKQNAAECLPLVMEPQSAFYNSPLVVLDFQSLYPSIMVSQNYCYSTCLGRAVDFQGKNKFGVIENLPRVPGLLEKLYEDITVSPNGLIFVKSHVRKGLLPRMLTELLDTRVMVKSAMKGAKEDKVLTRILNARQLGLKYIANVTYGYTSASFSGRMPAVEIADSIVQSGRETLEKAIRLITETTKWNAEVVYGDTDSLFIYLPGRTREQAFILGHEIADTITRQNPKPMFLKFEKVYHPCVLLAKKRYVGWKYESPDDNPVFDAKGIETVRRDGVRAAQIMTERCLKVLFRTQDLSEVKEYCCDTWSKLLEGRLPARDFVFAKEVRLGTYAKNVPPPPGAAVAAQRALLDPNDEPQYGERIPYVIVRRLPGTRLVDRAMDPLEFLNNNNLHLDAIYYIERVLIPPLERIFNLVGADVRQWYNEMARPKSLEVVSPTKRDSTGVVMSERFNIYEHFDTAHCLTCGDFTFEGLCHECRESTETSQTSLLTRLREGEQRLVNSHSICTSCAGLSQAEMVPCISLDCPWLFTRKGAEESSELLKATEDLVRQLNTATTAGEDPKESKEESRTAEGEGNVQNADSNNVVDE
ncbi:DNA polymerase zeta [Marasmius sp. AFHP31]|nr:DNA polymerase zeta [Marasmius sp. AFHP31]